MPERPALKRPLPAAEDPARELERRLRAGAYQGYAYAYPHKSAYRALARPRPLRELWAAEERSALFLYLHLPFCAVRCGFCNLFTRASEAPAEHARFVAQLEREAEQVAAALGPASYARVAIGGGTPTQLAPALLARVLDLVRALGADPARVPAGVEASPDTATPERLALLREAGFARLSLGVQSFVEEECRAAGRPQRSAEVERAIAAARAAGFPRLNLDLIYGLPGQDAASWERSLAAALEHAPEELFLYPLYVRPLTGLERTGRRGGDEELRLRLYRQGRQRLLEAGYRQVSMRFFTRAGEEPAGPAYSCQDDGMVGLGCGARSYTRGLHYSGEYGVSSRSVRAILDAYLEREPARFAQAEFGCALDLDEQQRRYAIQSLLWREGLCSAAFAARFGCAPAEALPQLELLEPRGLARREGSRLRLTPAGLERSDVLGPWLTSARVRALMEAYELR